MPQSCCPPQPTNCKPGSNQQTVCLLLKPDGNSKIRATRTITVAEDCTETFEYEAQVDSYNPLTGYSRADEIACGDGASIPFAPLGGGGGGGGGGDATAANQVVQTTALNSIDAGIPAALGSQTDSTSLGVALSTQDRATLTTISTNTGNTNTSVTNMSAKLPALLGQKPMATSLAVVLASDQSAIPVTVSGSGGVATLGTRLLNAVASATSGTPVTNIAKGVRTFQCWGRTTSSTGIATVVVEGSLDGTRWDEIGTFNLTLSTTDVPGVSSGSITDQSSFLRYRGRVTLITGGVGANVTMDVGV
jgi:hypothetical protein